ncbi:MAG: MFS transporter [Candidatus Heimdallarchaeota archaeon]
MSTNGSINEPENQEPQYNFRGYIFFLVGQMVSLLGSSVVQFAIIWWITLETNSEAFLALAALAGFGPTIVLTPIAGVFVDRWSRKKVIATVDFIQALVTVVLIYLFMVGQADVWIVLAVTAIRAVFQAFHGPAVQAITPLLVPKDKLSRLNGIQYLANGLIYLIGPVVGALLLEYWLLYEVLWLDAITFVFAVVPTIIISIPSVIDSAKKEKTPFRAELSEGMDFIRKKRGLLALLSVFTAANFFVTPLFILLPLYVTKVHLGGPGDLALMMAAQQAGLILGALLMSSWKGFSNNAYGVGVGIFSMYIGLFIIALTPFQLFLVAYIGMFIGGFMLPVANVSSQTIWQSVVPPEKLGRVFSVRITIAQITAPLAMIVTGAIAGAIGIINFFLLSGGIGMFFLGYSWFFTGFTRVEATIQEEEIQGVQTIPSVEPITEPSSDLP